MNLIAILLALGVEYLLGSLDEYRRFAWFHEFIERVRNRFAEYAWADGPVGVIIAFAPILIVVAMAWWVAAGLLWILGFLFVVAVLVYSIGPKDLDEDASGYLAASERGDHEGAAWYAGETLGDDEAVGTPEHVAARMYEGVLVQAHERLLGVLIWFVILGPLGAILFRLGCEARRGFADTEGGFGKSVHDLYRILIWPSARVVALGYALAGSFVGAVSRWGSMAEFWRRDSEELLVASGSGALNHDVTPVSETGTVTRVRDALALSKRTLVVGIVVLALMTLAGWAG